MDVHPTLTGAGTLRAAIIGLGVGEQHIDGYRRHPGCEVAVLCDHSPRRLAEVSGRHPELRAEPDTRAVLTDPGIDVVSIASHDDAHAEQVLLALAHGKHVFVEKPLCRTREEALAIRAALAGNPGLRLSSNLVLRQSPRLRVLRRLIADGDLGEIFHVEGEYNYGRVHKLTDGWRGRIEGYSVVLGGAVHLVDQLLWLTGRRVVEVAAFGNGIATRGTGFTGHDMAAALLRFEDGATGTVTANFACVRPHGHGLTVCGTKGTFVNDEPHGRLYLSRDPGTLPQLVTAPHPGAAKGDLIAGFVDEVLGRGRAEVGVEDVFRSLAVCLAIDEARRRRVVVTVEEL